MSLLLSTTVAVPANATTLTIAGTFALPYQILLSTSWITDFSITNKTATAFTVTFSVPAPAAGGTLDYSVFGTPGSVASAPTGTQASGTLAIPANATTFTVTGTFTLPYQVSLSSSWSTDFSITNKTLTSFLVTFSVAAPTGAGTLDYTVFSAPIGGSLCGTGLQYALSDYLTQTRRLLRDEIPGGSLYNDTDLTEFINRAMRQRDLDLGLNRLRMRFTLSSGVYDYSLNSILSSATVLDGNPCLHIVDVLSIIVIPLGGATSAIRYPLARWPYSKMAYLLSTSYPTYPVVYAWYGTQTLMFGPPPAGNYPTELDFIGASPDLVATTDTDYLTYPYTDPIPFLAAAFAKMGVQRFDEAQQFERIYAERLNRVRSRSRSIAVTQPWTDLPLRVR